MQGSWRITRIAGIDLSVHWTFGLLLAWVFYASVTGFGLAQGLVEVMFVLTLFGCVVLHELGHAMAARLYGIPTHGITLLPIGGVAQLDRIPRNPWQEWVIALAGPAVNVFIVGLLLPLVAALQGASAWASPLAIGGNFLARLMWVNVMLVCFNLLPAFPMDGGRIFRSFLALRMDYVTATLWAKRAGQAIAVLFALLGWWANPMLMLIAAFVFFAAESEYRSVRQEAGLATPAVSPSGSSPSGSSPATLLDVPPPTAVPVPIAHDHDHAPPTARSPRGQAAYHHILPDGVVIIRTLPASGYSCRP